MKVKHTWPRVMKAPHKISIPLWPHEAYLHDRARRISRDQERARGRLMKFFSLSKYIRVPRPSLVLSIRRVTRRV